NAATLTDSAASFTIDALIDDTVNNTTDGSSCVITDNDATTITCTLAGGTDNDWDTGDAYTVVPTGDPPSSEDNMKTGIILGEWGG
ncbi:MAG: hypothetical protein ACXABY_29980, partial [Candidatus Thorarchaeota archaeon]